MHEHRQSPILEAGTLREALRRYDYSGSSLLGDRDPRFPHAGDRIRERGYVLRDELYEIARWKSPRRAGLVHRNSLQGVHRVTGKALARKDRDPGRAGGLVPGGTGLCGAEAPRSGRRTRWVQRKLARPATGRRESRAACASRLAKSRISG
jgi:hypothetical protein